MSKLAVVYEISRNPLFDSTADRAEDRLTEFAQPTEINDLLRVLEQLGHQTIVVDGPIDLLNRADTIRSTCDFVFNKSIGFSGLERKIHVPAICQLFDLNLLGSSAYAMTLARHKYHTNRLLAGFGLPVPKAVLWQVGESVNVAGFRSPLIVKPNHESDAIGISNESIVETIDDALDRAKWVYTKYRQPAVIEEFIPGEEWKIPVIGNGPDAVAVGCVGVMRDGSPIIDSLQTREDLLSSRLNYYEVPGSDTSELAKSMAVLIHRALGLHDYSRCDFRLRRDGSPVCMEVSTHPGIDLASSFVAAALQQIDGHAAVVQAIIAAAERRFALGCHQIAD